MISTTNNLLEELQPYICVEKPYNILENLQEFGNGLKATITNEYLYKQEGGPISCGEVGRHLAILGSLALAKAYNFNSKHYYLAIDANINRLNNDVYTSENFTFYAESKELGKRKGIISGYVKDENGETIYEGEVEYQVIPEVVFNKIFAKNLNNTPIENTVSPYINRKELTDFLISENGASANYGIVEPYQCEGHFRNYPALPVAIVANLFMELGIKLCKAKGFEIFNKLIVTKAQISASKLAFSGENVSFKANLEQIISYNEAVVSFEALVEGNVIATGRAVMTGIA